MYTYELLTYKMIWTAAQQLKATLTFKAEQNDSRSTFRFVDCKIK